jgi:putative 4-mercaptohistidine N1-methyltranferase
MGGSFISTGNEASVWARLHFRRHFFQHAGFRLAQSCEQATALQTTCLDAPPPHVGTRPCCSSQKESSEKSFYEMQHTLNKYLLLHYGNYEETLSYPLLPQDSIGFPARCAQFLGQMADKYTIKPTRALDVGCAVGGAVFELARNFSQVIGIDLGETFIAAANLIKKTGNIKLLRAEEGDIATPLAIKLDAAINRNHVDFRVGDACALPSDLGLFDAVLLANILCRLPSPKSCLGRMGGPLGLVRPGGLLLITSPYSWLEDYTPAAAWLGGKQNTRSITGLHRALDNDFEFLEETNMPLIIREHARKFEYIIAHATLWRRKL